MCLQEEIETQRQQHEARVMSIRTEEKQKMDKMADDLDQKWSDALQSVSLSLRFFIHLRHPVSASRPHLFIRPNRTDQKSGL